MTSARQFELLKELGFRKEAVGIKHSQSRKIKVNRCQCRNCGNIIESKHRHDFVACKCGLIFTDGGIDYIRRGFQFPDDVIDLTEFED